MATNQAVHRGNIANGRMEPDIVVVVDKVINHPFSILERKRGSGSDGLFFEGAMITL